MSAAGSQASSGDGGFTLIELLVYCLLLVVVMGVVGSLFISTLRTEQVVRAETSASTEGQLVASSVQSGIRNASAFLLTVPRGTDQLLVARVPSGGAVLEWRCRAWYYSAGTGSIRTRESAAAIAVPSAAQLGSWTLLGDGIAPVAGTGVFAGSGRELTVSFTESTGGDTPVESSGSAVSRPGATGSLPCF